MALVYYSLEPSLSNTNTVNLLFYFGVSSLCTMILFIFTYNRKIKLLGLISLSLLLLIAKSPYRFIALQVI